MSSSSSSSRTPRGEDWQATRKRVLERDDYECQFCGVSNEGHKEEYDRGLSAHHIIPEGDGGSDDVDNLIAVCQSCHRTLEATHAKAVAELDRERNREEVQAKAVATFALRKSWATVDSLDDALGEFSDGHPTFRGEFGLYDENADDAAQSIESHRLQEMLGDVSSEWAFLVNWGYKRGMIEAAGFIDGWGATVIDDEALADSDLPDPRGGDDT